MSIFLGIALTLLLASREAWAAGALDPAFGTGGEVITDFGSIDGYSPLALAYAVAIQGDGKLVAAGQAGGGHPYFALARYGTDGSLDPSFGSGGKVLTDVAGGGYQNVARALAVQPDGKLVAAGQAWSSSGLDFGLTRYNTDGSLDSTFGNGGKVTTNVSNIHVGYAYALAIQSDGKLVVAGNANLGDGESAFALARYNADGTLDPGFGAGRCSASRALCDVNTPCPPPEACGGVVLGPITGASDNVIYALAIQSNGKIVAAGQAGLPQFEFALARYNTNGSPDSSFGNGGTVSTDFGDYDYAHAVVIQSDGKLVAAGPGGNHFALARYNTNGSLDSGFGTGGKVTTDFGGLGDRADALAIQGDGKLVVAGTVASGSPVQGDFAVARYNTDGSLDSSFGNGGRVTTVIEYVPVFQSFSEANALAVQADGNLVAAGSWTATPTGVFALARYLATSCGDGIVDADDECDDGVANGSAASCCTADCRYAAAGRACTGDVCDATGTCGAPTSTTTSTTISTTTTSPSPTSSTSLTTSSTTETPASTTTTIPPCTTARCTLDAGPQSPDCAGDTIPAGITRKLDKAVYLIDLAGSAGPRKAKRLLRQAAMTLTHSMKAAAKAEKGKRPKLSTGCAESIRRAADGARGRLGL